MSRPRRFWDFMKVRKRFWVPPLVIGLVIIAGLAMLTWSQTVFITGPYHLW